MKKLKLLVTTSLVVTAVAAFAFSDNDVPVEDLSAQVDASSTQYSREPAYHAYHGTRGQASHSLEAVNRTHQLQQEVQQLRGLVEVLTHDIKMMQTQQRNLYRDLDKRLEQVNHHQNNHVAKHQNQRASTTASNAMRDTAAIVQPTNDPQHYDKQFMRGKHDADETFLVEQNMYRKAYTLIKDKKYQTAITMMKAFLETYPQGRYSANAHYWLGELYLISGDNETANSHFNTVVKQFPDHNKSADALLKLGLMSYEAGNLQGARDYFSRVQKQYPTTAAAHLAAAKLRRFIKQRKATTVQ